MNGDQLSNSLKRNRSEMHRLDLSNVNCFGLFFPGKLLIETKRRIDLFNIAIKDG